MIALLGLRNADAPLPILDVVIGERRLTGIAGHIWDLELTAAVRMLASGQVDPTPLITARVPLSKITEGFTLQATNRDALEIHIDPTT
jgi:threonine dehydrogenase-like Zn-dependent dehydrogenase